jgi:Tfp pilus assembly protein PilX
VKELMPFLPDRCIRSVRRLTRRLAQEHGISLLLALISLVVLSTVGGGVAVYTSSNLRHSYSDQSTASAYHLAEAGLAEAMSRLQGADDPTAPTVLTSTTRNDGSLGGKYTYSGTSIWTDNGSAVPNGTVTADKVTWTVTATGSVGNPARTSTLTQTADVKFLVAGGNVGAWSRFYQGDPNTCLTIDTVTMPAPLATPSDLCLINGGAITGAGTSINVGKSVYITGPLVTGGTHYPATGAGWTNPTNVYTNNGAYATNSIGAVATGANQDTTNFTLGIPTGAKILGIQVSLERLASACCNVNEVQTISETGSPTAGTFTLTGTPPGGSSKTSASIARNATAATVQTALTASTMYGTGNVSCTGGPLPTTTVTCSFVGAYASMAVSTMTFTKSGFSPSGATVVIANPTGGAAATLQDGTVQLLKAGAPVGNNKAVASTWSTTTSTQVNYGTASDLWGTTWTAADLNASNFGLRFAAKNTGAGTATASLDWVDITVTYNDDTTGIGTSAIPIHDATVGGTCTYNGQAADTPCKPADHVYAGTMTMGPFDPTMVLPKLDLNNDFLNARPGPKHPCTNAGNGLAPLEFDNDNSAASNDSLLFDNSSTYDMTPLNRDYDCQVVENGVLLGRLAWNHTNHVLTIGGTIFFDGDVRFDDDGQLIHYQGRALIYAAGDVEFDELVCSGGHDTPTTGSPLGSSCVTNMSNWDPTKNMMVLQAHGNSEYDQGGSGCSNLAAGVTCNGIHPQSGFQGLVSAQGTCMIHERFFLSGPVLCQNISLPYQSDGWPTYFPFPAIGSLIDGQKYGDQTSASAYEITPGPQSG